MSNLASPTETTSARPPRPPRPPRPSKTENTAPVQPETATTALQENEIPDTVSVPTKSKKTTTPEPAVVEESILLRLSVTTEPRQISPDEIAGFSAAVVNEDQAAQVACIANACALLNSRRDRNSEMSQAIIEDVAARGQILDPIRLYLNPETGGLEAFDGLTRLLGVIRARQNDPQSFESIPVLVYRGPISEVAYLEDALNSLRLNFNDSERVIAVRQFLSLGGTPERYLSLSGHPQDSPQYREARTLVEVAQNEWSAAPVIDGTLALASARKIMATADTDDERKRQFEIATSIVNTKLKEAAQRRQSHTPEPTGPGPKPKREVTSVEKNAIEREALQSVGASQVRTRGMTVQDQRRQLFELISDNPDVAHAMLDSGVESWDGILNQNTGSGAKVELSDARDAVTAARILTRLEILGVPDLDTFVKSASSAERITWLGNVIEND